MKFQQRFLLHGHHQSSLKPGGILSFLSIPSCLYQHALTDIGYFRVKLFYHVAMYKIFGTEDNAHLLLKHVLTGTTKLFGKVASANQLSQQFS